MRSLMLLLVMPVLLLLKMNLVVFRALQMMLMMLMRLMGHQNQKQHNNISSNVLKTTKFIFSNKESRQYHKQQNQ